MHYPVRVKIPEQAHKDPGQLSWVSSSALCCVPHGRTLWAAEDFQGHYTAIALRFFDALRDSPVRFAVSLTAMGSEPTRYTAISKAFMFSTRS